jgi:4-diphosphocytidyl-2-C-methyl-D-erythritol kinase
MENDLEAAALSLRPELAGTLAKLGEAGALAARISGSGPTAFGVFATRAEAETAATQFPEALVTRLRNTGP